MTVNTIKKKTTLHLFAVIYLSVKNMQLQTSKQIQHVHSRHLFLCERNGCYNGAQFSYGQMRCDSSISNKPVNQCTAKISLFQFGFSRKKRNGVHSDEGNVSFNEQQVFRRWATKNKTKLVTQGQISNKVKAGFHYRISTSDRIKT